MFVKIISWGFKKTTFYVSFSISYVNTSVASSHFFINIFHSVTQKIILVSFFTCFANYDQFLKHIQKSSIKWHIKGSLSFPINFMYNRRLVGIYSFSLKLKSFYLSSYVFFCKLV